MCLGEVLVDFICERAVEGLADGDAFVPHFGGSRSPPRSQPRSPSGWTGRPRGAGDILTGVLLARLATSGCYPPAVVASLPEAVAQSALACERWGALD